MNEHSDQLLSDDEISCAIWEYELNVEAVAEEFKERTKLQDADAAFLVLATALQVLRMVLVKKLMPAREKAGSDNKLENKLHSVQEEVLGRFKGSKDIGSTNLHASLTHIISARGVPYDATRYETDSLGILKGANHRFMTLGHDPLLGLVFGTANILTNTITTYRKSALVGFPLVPTHLVKYDANRKNPYIASRSVMTTRMLNESFDRLKDDKPAVTAAIIKQVIHVGTDVFTTKGIQLPLTGLVLDNASVEKLTDYVGMAEAVEIGASASLSVFVNWLIATLHGSTIVFQDDGTDFCTELYQARTRKILSLSNSIASSSNLIWAVAMRDATKVDIGGLGVTIYRLFSDLNFITRLKYEYLNSEVSKIYEAKGEGLVDESWLDAPRLER